MKMASSESQVQGTNDSATLSKCSTSQTGYYKDSFVSCFVTHCPRRAPIIHWGYWIRNQTLEWIQNEFLDCKQLIYKQILSVGAGFDTSYFRLKSNGKLKNTIYFEVDYPEVVSRKRSIISNCHTSLIHEDDYRLIGCDITHLDKLERLLFEEGDIKKDTPTLIMAEVVLTYIKPQDVNAILSWASNFFSSAVFCTYEQINACDAFGQIMLRHFETLSSPLLNIGLYPTQGDNQQRFRKMGWSDVVSCDVNSFYFSLPPDVQRKPFSIEPFDEYEEWHLKCAHYQVLCAFVGSCSSLRNSISPPLGRRDTEALEERCEWVADSEEQSWQLQRYGHASIELSDRFLIHGGFGKRGPNHTHSRLDSVVLIGKAPGNSSTVSEVKTTGDTPGRIIHHSLTLLPSGDILLIGGRGSPKHSSSEVYLLTKLEKEEEKLWNWRKVEVTTGYEFEGRWRHTASLVNGGVVLIMGGCTTRGRVLDDMWQLDTRNWKMERLSLSLPRGTHSHTAVNRGQQEVLVIGGLDSDLRPLSTSLRLYKKAEWIMEPLEFSPPLPARYSMSGHMMTKDLLILVGGVQIHSCPDVAPIIVADLNKHTWKAVNIKYPTGMPLPLLHGHTSFITQEGSSNSNSNSSRVVIVGGGGNCFSFGTHFNSTPLNITALIN